MTLCGKTLEMIYQMPLIGVTRRSNLARSTQTGARTIFVHATSHLHEKPVRRLLMRLLKINKINVDAKAKLTKSLRS